MQTAMRSSVAFQAAPRPQQAFCRARAVSKASATKAVCFAQPPASGRHQQPGGSSSYSGSPVPAAPVPQAAASSSSSSSSSSQGVVCHAAMDASLGGAMEQPQAARQAQWAQWLALAGLGCLFAAWYASNIYFNIYNKQVLRVFAHPLTTTNACFAVSALASLFFWATGAVARPKLSKELLANVLPLALIHVVGNVLTNISLGLVAVSFTNTVKAMEPFFSVLMSALFLGEVPPLPVLATLVPIVGGVLVASLSETSFNWTGFLAAMFSNITFQSRNVLSKKFMKSKGSLDNINLFQVISVMACLLLLPVTLLVEGLPLLPANLAAAGIDPAMQSDLFRRMLSAGVCFHGYQQLSYMVLSRVAPVTHSVGNCVKRVVVIVASVIAFQNPMSQQSAAGTALALAGVFLYSQVKRSYKDSGSSKPAQQ